MAPVTMALVHWPILDKSGNIVATTVTNFDVHDISRAARTYGVQKYFIVNKMQEQLMYVSRVLDHWSAGKGSAFNDKRRQALNLVNLAETVEEAISQHSVEPLVVATAARDVSPEKAVSFSQLKKKIEGEDRPIFLLFGTGYGLDESTLELCDLVLEPIKGRSEDDYRHLSVRSAVSICLDRLLGL